MLYSVICLGLSPPHLYTLLKLLGPFWIHQTSYHKRYFNFFYFLLIISANLACDFGSLLAENMQHYMYGIVKQPHFNTPVYLCETGHTSAVTKEVIVWKSDLKGCLIRTFTGSSLRCTDTRWHRLSTVCQTNRRHAAHTSFEACCETDVSSLWVSFSDVEKFSTHLGFF